MPLSKRKNLIYILFDRLFYYLCSRKELFDRNTPQITEFATVAKSLPYPMRKAHKWLISNLFLFFYRIFEKNPTKSQNGKNSIP